MMGASGNVGRYVVQYALAAGQKVKAAGTNVKRLTQLFPNAEAVLFDVTKPSTFPAALQDVDRVFLMRPPHLGDPKALKPLIDPCFLYSYFHIILPLPSLKTAAYSLRQLTAQNKKLLIF